MEIIKEISYFKDAEGDLTWFEQWAHQVEKYNGRTYERITVETSLGHTHVWGLNTHEKSFEPIVIFPGARTSALFWDFDRGLDYLGRGYRIYLVETNGLPNNSDGATPDIKSLNYGKWAAEVINHLGLKQTFVAGASFGGLIAMKLAIVAPDLVKSVFLLNPGCLQPFSLGFKNLYYNLLPIVIPTYRNVRKFLNKAIFCKPNHSLSTSSEELIINYELFALKNFVDNTQKPYFMKNELRDVTSSTYLLVGNRDLLFPYRKSIKNAELLIPGLKETYTFSNTGHGIETHYKALLKIGKLMSAHRNSKKDEFVNVI